MLETVEFRKIQTELSPKNKNGNIFVDGIVKLQAEISKIKQLSEKLQKAAEDDDVNDFVFKSQQTMNFSK